MNTLVCITLLEYSQNDVEILDYCMNEYVKLFEYIKV